MSCYWLAVSGTSGISGTSRTSGGVSIFVYMYSGTVGYVVYMQSKYIHATCLDTAGRGSNFWYTLL